MRPNHRILIWMLLVSILFHYSCEDIDKGLDAVVGAASHEVIVENETSQRLGIFLNGIAQGIVAPGGSLTVPVFSPGTVYLEAKNSTTGMLVASRSIDVNGRVRWIIRE